MVYVEAMIYLLLCLWLFVRLWDHGVFVAISLIARVSKMKVLIFMNEILS